MSSKAEVREHNNTCDFIRCDLPRCREASVTTVLCKSVHRVEGLSTAGLGLKMVPFAELRALLPCANPRSETHRASHQSGPLLHLTLFVLDDLTTAMRLSRETTWHPGACSHSIHKKGQAKIFLVGVCKRPSGPNFVPVAKRNEGFGSCHAAVCCQDLFQMRAGYPWSQSQGLAPLKSDKKRNDRLREPSITRSRVTLLEYVLWSVDTERDTIDMVPKSRFGAKLSLS